MTVGILEVLRIDVIGDFDGSEDVVNVYQLRQVREATCSDTEAMSDLIDLFTELYTMIKSMCNALTIWRRIRVTRELTGELVGEAAFSPPLTGTATGEPLPSQITFPLNFPTGIPRVTLRKFIGPGAKDQSDIDGLIAAAPLVTMGTIGAWLLVAHAETYSTWRYGYNSPKTLGWVQPISVSFGNVFGAVRSRRVGVGT